MADFVIRGARGTTPACGAVFRRYGGNTTCFSVRTETGLVIFDAGTGISNVARELADNPSTGDITLFLTHLHMDHLVGLPSFKPLYQPDTRLRIMADPRRDDDWRQSLQVFMRRPFWPIALVDSQAHIQFEDLPPSGGLETQGLVIDWLRVPHPQQCVAYRVRAAEFTAVIATDAEYSMACMDDAFIDFCAQADYLIYDAQYLPEEYAAHEGWGHSTWETAAAIAAAAGVGELVLTHHEPWRTDDAIDAIVRNASEIFSPTRAAADNMLINPEKR